MNNNLTMLTIFIFSAPALPNSWILTYFRDLKVFKNGLEFPDSPFLSIIYNNAEKYSEGKVIRGRSCYSVAMCVQTLFRNELSPG